MKERNEKGNGTASRNGKYSAPRVQLNQSCLFKIFLFRLLLAEYGMRFKKGGTRSTNLSMHSVALRNLDQIRGVPAERE